MILRKSLILVIKQTPYDNPIRLIIISEKYTMLNTFTSPNFYDEFTSRTICAETHHFATRGIPGYIYQTPDYKHWNWVRHDVDFAKQDETSWASMGSSAKRENLLFDANSARLIELRQQVIAETLDKPVREVLETVNNIVDNLTAIPGKLRNERELELDAELSAFLKAEFSRTGSKDISIDKLIEEKKLVCRHKAIIVAYVLGELIRLGILPPGEARHYRSDLRDLSTSPTTTTKTKCRGVHSWALYKQNEGGLWMCDPRWLSVKNLDNTRDLCLAGEVYGGITILKMIDKLNGVERKEDEFLPPSPGAAYLPMASPVIQGSRIPSAIPPVQELEPVRVAYKP